MKKTSPKTTDSPSPQIVTETKFMQNYRVATAVNAGSDVVAVCNGSGNVELFTLGSDGTVWNFYPDPTSDTGYSGVSTGLIAGAISVGVGSDGKLIVFAGVGLQLVYIVEINSATARWSTPANVQLPLPPNATRIARVYTQEIAGSLYVGVLTQFTSVPGPSYSLSYSIWQTSAPSFQRTPMNLNSLNCVWLGNAAANATFACVDTVIVGYNTSTGVITRYPMAATFSSISVDAATDSAGNSQIFAILADGNAYHLAGGTNNQPYSWVQLSQAMTFRQIDVDTDGSGNIQVLAVSGDNSLYHWEPQASSQTGYSFPPASIFQNVARLAVAANDGGDIDLFAIGTAQNTLTHLYQEQQTSNWQTQRVEVPTNGQVEEYVSYTSDVTLSDAVGALLVNSPVSVWAAEETKLTINGATYFVDAHRPARTSTNSAGMLSIAQETGSLAIPAIQINLTGVMPPDTSIAIQQSGGVQSDLATVQGTDLMDAKDVNGDYLLADQYRNQTTTDSLASAFNKCMSLTGSAPPNSVALPTKRGPKPGIFLRSSGLATDLRLIATPAVEQHWQLSFNGFDVRYRDLTREEAFALLVEKRASIQSSFGMFDWLDDVGDFLAGVVDGVISVVDTVITTVAQGVQAAFTFIVNGVTYLYETVITFVEQAFDAVEAFFAQVKVFFEKIFEWLGFLFNWPDILRTHVALSYAVNEFLTFLQGSAAGVQTIVDNGLSNFQNQIATLFDYAVQQIAGNATIGGYQESNNPPDPQFDSGVSNNIVYNNFIDNAGSASSALLTADGAPADDPLSIFMQSLETFASNTQMNAAFTSAQQYFQNLGGSPDQIFSQLLAGLLRIVEGVLQAIIAGVQALVDTMLQLAQLLVAALQSMLNETWDIPFVSQFYNWLTDSDLTTLDLVALMAAIPATVVYKALNNVAPFPTDDSVTAFKNAFNAQTMLAAAGFGPPAESVKVRRASKAKRLTQAEDAGGLLPVADANVMATLAAVTGVIYGWVTAVNDAFPKEAPKAVSYAAFLLEVSAQIGNFPWWYSSGATSCDPNNADGCARSMWIVQNLGILMDAVFLKLDGRLPENTNDAGVVVQFAYSLVHLDLAILASESTSGLPVAANILPVIPELSKLLRLTAVQEATRKISLGVLAVIDAAFYTAGGICTFKTEYQSAPSEQAFVTAG